MTAEAGRRAAGGDRRTAEGGRRRPKEAGGVISDTLRLLYGDDAVPRCLVVLDNINFSNDQYSFRGAGSDLAGVAAATPVLHIASIGNILSLDHYGTAV